MLSSIFLKKYQQSKDSIFINIHIKNKNNDKPELEPVSLLTQINPMSKQKYNSKFQEFETARIVKIQKTRPNLDQTHHTLQTTMRKQTK